MRFLSFNWIAIGILAITPLFYSQENRLPSKPYQEWSKNEAEQVLEDSPWVAMQEVRLRYASQTRRVAGGTVPSDTTGGLLDTTSNSAEMGGAEAPVDFQFTLRLRSAVIVRQALVRFKQLEPNSAKSEKDRTAFDARLKGLLECPACEQNYVLTLSSKSKERPGADAIFTTFKGGRVADMQRYIFIANSRGERRELIHFVPPKAPGDEAVFYFPRFNEKGEPLLTAADTVLVANFTNNDVNMNINFRIDVSKLVVNGQVDF
ncbi:MAG TPA: hypothetical protein VGJ66_14000 [Pyrinomonadaceae bacterium]